MLLQEERALVVEYGKKMIEEGISIGTFGNISVYSRTENLIAISPSGLDYFKTEPQDVVVIDRDGKKVDGDRKPSSEAELHRIFYAKRQDVNAVVHTHSEYACVLAVLNQGIPPIHYTIAFAGQGVPCTTYAPVGSYALAQSALEAMGDGYACILGNHGLVCAGPTLAYAFDVAQQIEFLAGVYCRAKALGDPVLLKEEYISVMLDKFKAYRQK